MVAVAVDVIVLPSNEWLSSLPIPTQADGDYRWNSIGATAQKTAENSRKLPTTAGNWLLRVSA
eukprot:15477447-Alexandrium_andersonii.AAC.1